MNDRQPWWAWVIAIVLFAIVFSACTAWLDRPHDPCARADMPALCVWHR